MQNEMELKKHRCCFTGHRPEKLGVTEKEVKKLLKQEITKAIENGYTTFISGMARGIDMWAAEIVLEERKSNADIKLICASPYNGFENRWSNDEKEKYRDIIEKADYVKYVCEHYSKQCFQIRNIYMVDRSSRVIAAYNGASGGTENTIAYSRQKQVEVINIFE